MQLHKPRVHLGHYFTKGNQPLGTVRGMEMCYQEKLFAGNVQQNVGKPLQK